MKIKNGFILRDVGGKTFVVAVGERSREFKGMITLNETGKFIWKALENENTVDGVVDGNTVTLTVTFDEDNALGTKFSKKNDSTDKYQVPVIVRINGKAYRLSNAADAVVKVVSCEYDEQTRVATIVFTLNA